jgi:hypothetical protein
MLLVVGPVVGACASSAAREGFSPELPEVPDAAAPAPEAGGRFGPSDARSDVEASADGGCEPCKVTGPGTFCGLDVGITPYVTGGPFGGFQSVAGTGFQQTITVTLSKPITWVSLKILDPDYPNNLIRVYDETDQLRGEVAFDSDGAPNVLTNSSKGLGGGLIRRLELVPDAQDYVAYDELTIIPTGCEAPAVN